MLSPLLSSPLLCSAAASTPGTSTGSQLTKPEFHSILQDNGLLSTGAKLSCEQARALNSLLRNIGTDKELLRPIQKGLFDKSSGRNNPDPTTPCIPLPGKLVKYLRSDDFYQQASGHIAWVSFLATYPPPLNVPSEEVAEATAPLDPEAQGAALFRAQLQAAFDEFPAWLAQERASRQSVPSAARLQGPLPTRVEAPQLVSAEITPVVTTPQQPVTANPRLKSPRHMIETFWKQQTRPSKTAKPPLHEFYVSCLRIHMVAVATDIEIKAVMAEREGKKLPKRDLFLKELKALHREGSLHAQQQKLLAEFLNEQTQAH